jgi:hypothetical protein
MYSLPLLGMKKPSFKKTIDIAIEGLGPTSPAIFIRRRLWVP